MKLTSLFATAATVTVASLVAIADLPAHFIGASSLQAVAAENPIEQMSGQEKIDMLLKNKGQFGSGDLMRRMFFADLSPIAVQPGGAGMVVNLYNAENNVTIAYCADYDVVVNIGEGRITAFAPEDVR